MKTLLKWLACSACIVLACCGVLSAQSASSVAQKPAAYPLAGGGIFTLYALDPLARALCFRDGREGLTFLKNRWEERCNDLSFTLAGGGSLVSGIERNRTASIIDLGTADELSDRYGYDDAFRGGAGFASLQLQGDGLKLMVLKKNEPETLQPLKEGAQLFTNAEPSANAPVKLGHIYLVRLTDSKDRSFQLIVKLMVIAYRQGESVTLRWVLL